MKRSVLSLGFAATFVAGTLAASGAPASATTDTTPPSLSIAKYTPFVIGGQVNTYPEGDGALESDAPVHFTWRSSDASGICDTFLWQETRGDGPGRASYRDPTLNSWSDIVNDNDDVGGGWQLDGWWVEVRDCAGNQTNRWVRGGRPVFTQDTGEYGGNFADDTTISYSSRNWSISNCTCWSAGTTHKTFTAGASATISHTVVDTGEHLALVMEKAPDRGKFKVLIDGVYKTTVDTYSPTKRHRTIVWQTSFTTKGAHKVKIVNLATAGRPRLDLDAVITQLPQSPDAPPSCADDPGVC